MFDLVISQPMGQPKQFFSGHPKLLDVLLGRADDSVVAHGHDVKLRANVDARHLLVDDRHGQIVFLLFHD